jgi:hypothetical protein
VVLVSPLLESPRSEGESGSGVYNDHISRIWCMHRLYVSPSSSWKRIHMG